MALGYSAEIDGKSPWLVSSQPWGDPPTVILLNEHNYQTALEIHISLSRDYLSDLTQEFLCAVGGG